MTRFVLSGQARLACDDTGQGPAVVLIHAGVADRRCWTSTVEALSPRYRVVTLDLRGHGDTTFEPEPHDKAADVAAILDALGIEAAVIVGNSIGGHVASSFALAWPDRVLGLVLIGAAVHGAPVPADDPTSELDQLFERIDELEQAGDLDAVNALEARIWLDGPSRPEGAVRGAARELFLDMNARALAAPPAGDEIRPEGPRAWERLEEITAPVLALVGRHDLPHLVERTRVIADRVPDGRYVELPESAHVPALDDPQRLNQTLLRFLADVVA